LGAYRLRVGYVTSRLRMRFEERLAERTRIARELHDNLLQSMLGISLQIEVTDELLPPDAPARRPLERALQLSKSAMAEGRRALNELRTHTVDAAAIAAAFSQAAKKVAAPEGPPVQILTEGEERPLNGVAGHDVVHIGCEAIANAVQHARARRVHVLVSYGRDRFRLAVTDNGGGFDEQMLREGKPGHYGVGGMRERAERIGGTLTIVSRIGEGSEVVLTVPGHLVYTAGSEAERA
jgi:signal transduction histidine kinase